ncbi:tubulin epsilon and delta complex protein 1 isoform X1 [Globicephala melas]|uniref:Tubulin epsilon and delta complex protein 1 isoform X2 n=1 Tax=Tursiops truncatus TaxID=9739 RepID=A0A6J3QUY8_TURTR|nr:tubulin epsilon and delta complex protein 1 isoform X1 [Globicephala melas]XP_033706320.1 tubulin epsilon and delta complex protein 1 isoform X2 [Tursiops truncatus]XP_059857250.1 tubulin epsilon and delta complex protein 1 isoform X1 [Delphinus delphis]
MGRRRRRRRVDPADAARALPEAIAALSQTLPAGPSPETFRRAKFDRPEAAPALWRLLFRVLSPQLADGASASFSPEAQVRSVKLALRTQGYPRRALAQLPDDGSQGGRELLLALAWLLARGPLPERLLTQNRVQLGDEMPVCECEALASPGPPAPSVEADGCVDIRHLQWLMGKLRFRWRNLMASQQEQCALLGKIHSYTRGCHSDRSLGHLSVTETELLRDPEGGRQLLRRLERENARLQAALEWRRRELVFWRWMDTVLGACPPEASQPTFLPRIPTPGTGALEPLVRELQALQGELREAVEARRAAWEAGVGGRGPQWSAARTALREAVGQDLAALRQACERGGGCSLAQPHGPHRLVRTEAGAPGGPGLRAPEVIEALRSQEARLEVVLRQLQGQCRQELARLVGAPPGPVWILPPGR